MVCALAVVAKYEKAAKTTMSIEHNGQRQGEWRGLGVMSVEVPKQSMVSRPAHASMSSWQISSLSLKFE